MDLQSNSHEKISIKADNYKTDSRKTDTFFVPQMKFLPKNNLYKADTVQNNFQVKRHIFFFEKLLFIMFYSGLYFK